MRLSELRSNAEILDEDLEQHPHFRTEWERTTLARVVANISVRYRADHGLSQRALADLLGWKQPQVARLELGEHTPTLETLLHLAAKLGLHVRLELVPVGESGEPQLEPPTVIGYPEGADLRVAVG